MQAREVLAALKISPAQGAHLAIIPPQEAGNDQISQPGKGDLGPHCAVPYVCGRHLGEPGLVLGVVVDALVNGLGQVGRDEDAAADDGEDDKHVAAHAGEAQKDGGIHADVGHELLLTGAPERRHPRPRLLAEDRRRRVLFVGVLELGRVHALVVGAQEGKGERDAGGDAKGRGHRSVDGCLL